jgi:hypothetical protein
MYYEEKIIDGILCYRYKPNGDWTKFTIESLSERAYNNGQKLKALRKCVMEMNTTLEK